MRVLTAADSNFYHCLTGLAQSVRKHYGTPLIIYDLGLTTEQRGSLDAEIVKIDLDVDYKGYTRHNNTDFINTTHKPFCIRHYFQTHSEPLIYADADCLFLEPVELDGFDAAVTVKPKKKRDPSNYFNGIINAGILFFNMYPERLIERWIEECLAGGHTDQSALAKVLSETIDWKETGKVYDWHGIRIKTLPIEVYNDYYLKSGKIFHFKGDRHKDGMYEHIITCMRENRPYRVKKKRPLEFLTRPLKSCLSIVDSRWKLKVHSALVERVNSVFGTHFKLAWKKHEYFDDEWDSRVKAMNMLMESEDKRILDLGCGKQYLRKYILPETTYLPVDYLSRGHDTIVCDFNKHEFPTVRADVCFCSGVLEYIEDLDWFVGMLAKTANAAVVSYNCKKDQKRKRPLLWVNALSETELLQLFEKHGFRCKQRAFHNKNDIFRFEKTEKQPQAAIA